MKIDGLPVYHLVAKLERSDVSLCELEVGSWMWEHLRAAFPAALAACSMPDHPHVLTPLADPDAGRVRPAAGFVEWYHRYVSSDPSVAVAGTPVPRPAMPTRFARVPLVAIAKAAAVATRSRADAIRRSGVTRDTFVALAREQGWRSTEHLAEACECTARAIRRIAERAPEPHAARLCLGDARLLRSAPSLAAKRRRSA